MDARAPQVAVPARRAASSLERVGGDVRRQPWSPRLPALQPVLKHLRLAVPRRRRSAHRDACSRRRRAGQRLYRLIPTHQMLVTQSKMWLTPQLSHNRIDAYSLARRKAKHTDVAWEKRMAQFTRPLRNPSTGGDSQFANSVAFNGNRFGSDFAVNRVFDDSIIGIPGRTAQRAAPATLSACKRYRDVSGAR